MRSIHARRIIVIAALLGCPLVLSACGSSSRARVEVGDQTRTHPVHAEHPGRGHAHGHQKKAGAGVVVEVEQH